MNRAAIPLAFSASTWSLHQGDQRRDDQRDPVKDQRRQLVAEGLAAAGRHQCQAVMASQYVGYYLFLRRPKAIVAESGLEDGKRCAIVQGAIPSLRRT